MIIVITNSEDVTADYVCDNFLSNVPFLRIDTDNIRGIGVHLNEGDIVLHHQNGVIAPSQVVGVWYRRPGRIVPPITHSDPSVNQLIAEEWTEAIEGFLEAIHFRHWMNHPRANIRASNKLHQLQVAQRNQIRIPATQLGMSSADARHHMHRHGRVITKPLGSGVISRKTGFTHIYTSEVAASILEADEQFGCPTLFQEKVKKRTDVRVTVVDTKMFAVEILSPKMQGEQALDIRVAMSESIATYAKIDIPPNVADGIIAMMQYYDIRFGAFDFAIDMHDNWIFFELNPNGQWAWLDMEAGLRIGPILAKHLSRARSTC